jgi:hypothetical protein
MKLKKETHSRIPLAELVQEGYDTQYKCEKDRTELLRAGIDWAFVETLSSLSDRCSRADVLWQVCKSNKKVIVGELQDMAKVAKNIRSKFADVIRASKPFVDSGRKLPSMSRNNKYEDIIQDLYDLYYIADRLCNNDSNAIADKNLMEQVLTMHHTLDAKYVERASYKDRIIDRAQQRDKAAEELKNRLVEIHSVGRNAFNDDPVKASRYCIRYYQMHRIKNRGKRKKSSQKVKKDPNP